MCEMFLFSKYTEIVLINLSLILKVACHPHSRSCNVMHFKKKILNTKNFMRYVYTHTQRMHKFILIVFRFLGFFLSAITGHH